MKSYELVITYKGLTVYVFDSYHIDFPYYIYHHYISIPCICSNHDTKSIITLTSLGVMFH